MFFIVDRSTPEDAPDLIDIDPPVPFGVFLGKPLRPPLREVRARLTSLRRVLDIWWISPYFVASSAVLAELMHIGETHFETIPLVLLDRKGNSLKGTNLIINLLDNVPCFDAGRSVFTRDEDGFVRQIDKLVIDESRVPPDRYLFRVEEGEHLILARDALVARFQALSVRGARFLPVASSQTF
jgi:hypothetical protein